MLLLPKDLARVINGLLYLPIDTMRAIAVLDNPAEMEEPEVTSGEVITYKESSNTEKNGAPYQSAAGRTRARSLTPIGILHLRSHRTCHAISEHSLVV